MAKDSVNVRSTKSSAAKTSSPKSSSEWREPQADWIPIGRAVFRFGIANSDSSTTAEAPSNGIALFSREAFEQSRKREEDSSPKIANYEPEPPSLEELTKLLQQKTHAREVKIDQEDGRFIFGFDVPGGGASTYSVTPWVLLAMPEAPLAIDPRVEAEALFNKEGLVRIRDEDAEYAAQQNRAVREATGLVWRQYMLRAFDRSVAEGRVKIYARVQSALAPFQRLPKELWPRLNVQDWQHGIAHDPEGTIYHSVHAASSSPEALAKQKAIFADETSLTKLLAEKLRADPAMSKAEAIAVCKSGRVSLRRFQSHVWPNARELADLPPLARPGRKKKSSH